MALIKSQDSANVLQEAVVLDLGDLRQQTLRLRARAEAEADRLLAEARAQAERLTADAAEQGRAAGYAEGHAEGLEAGRAQGRDEARRDAADRLAQLETAWRDALADWDARAARFRDEARAGVLRLAIAVAEKIVHRRVHADPTIAVDQVAAALEHVTGPCRVTVRVHPDDRAAVADALPGLVETLADVEHARLVDDPAVGRGGCVVASGHGRVDASIDTQIRRIAAAVVPDADDDADATAEAPDRAAAADQPRPQPKAEPAPKVKPAAKPGPAARSAPAGVSLDADTTADPPAPVKPSRPAHLAMPKRRATPQPVDAR